MSQSPVDLTNTVRNIAWTPIRFVGYDEVISDLKIFNNGHTVQVNLPRVSTDPRELDHRPWVRISTKQLIMSNLKALDFQW